MAYRALELLNLPPGPAFLLDIGCGSGLSGEILEEEGHVWVGMDIAPAMLGMWLSSGRRKGEHMLISCMEKDIAREREVEGDLFLHDAGHGVGFRPGVFDGAIR